MNKLLKAQFLDHDGLCIPCLVYYIVASIERAWWPIVLHILASAMRAPPRAGVRPCQCHDENHQQREPPHTLKITLILGHLVASLVGRPLVGGKPQRALS